MNIKALSLPLFFLEPAKDTIVVAFSYWMGGWNWEKGKKKRRREKNREPNHKELRKKNNLNVKEIYQVSNTNGTWKKIYLPSIVNPFLFFDAFFRTGILKILGKYFKMRTKPKYRHEMKPVLISDSHLVKSGELRLFWIQIVLLDGQNDSQVVTQLMTPTTYNQHSKCDQTSRITFMHIF